ncbi:hypothetical protein NLI96_g3887 [Meripilus lineatus]|uniref:CCR4-NOT transcription complex subunit 11 n=1 Tax=Meripilus lineatus TaxID=2056292 RepID=A0AAD5V7H4_9APHY|nr:hypothetical protein NLI96_g3887 [Physisporinus lineatus]
MQTTTAPYYSHPGPPGLAQAPIGTGGSIGVSGSGPIPGSSVSAGATGTSGGDPLAQRVSHLLSRAYNLPCSAAAQAFTQLVQPIARFQLALDVLLPLFLDTIVPLQQRILISYILYSLYAPHPIAINPFKSVLLSTFVKEKDKAVASTVNNPSATSGVGYQPSDNEQFVWVLWKILRGDGSDIGPFTPSNLARSPVPPKLRPEYLTIDDEDSLVKFDPFGDSPAPTPAPDRSKRTSSHPSTIQPTPSSDLKEKNKEEAPGVTSYLSREQEIEKDKENQRMADGMRLLLASRDRVLTLSEQRAWKYERKANDDALQILTPLIPKLTAPPAVITSIDLGGMISNNSALAYLAVVGLLSNAPTSSPPSIPPNGQGNPNENGNGIPLLSYLEVLRHLPPTLPSFDLFGRLLKDRTVVPDITIQQPSGLPVGGGNTTIADLVRLEVLGWFIHSCVDWLDRWDEEERSGGRFDGGFGIGVRNLCRFYTSLLKQSIIDPSSDADTAEMKHFTLRNSRIEDANRLYRLLVYPSAGGQIGFGGVVGSSGIGREGMGG